MLLVLFNISEAEGKKILGLKGEYKVVEASGCLLSDPHPAGEGKYTLRVSMPIGTNPDGTKHSARGAICLPSFPVLEEYVSDVAAGTPWYPLVATKAAALAADPVEVDIRGTTRTSTRVLKVALGPVTAGQTTAEVVYIK